MSDKRAGDADGRVATQLGGVEAPRPNAPMEKRSAPAEVDPPVATSVAGLGEDAPSDMGPVGGWLVVWEGPDRGAAHPLRLGSNSIGRDASCDVRLSDGDSSVSRTGLSLDYDQHEHRYVLVRQGTQFMPRVAGESVHVSRPLDGYDEIRIGAETTLLLVPFERRWT